MKIKEGCEVYTDDFWHSIAYEGDLNPLAILEDESEALRVIAAISLVKQFAQACEEQIDGFYV